MSALQDFGQQSGVPGRPADGRKANGVGADATSGSDVHSPTSAAQPANESSRSEAEKFICLTIGVGKDKPQGRTAHIAGGVAGLASWLNERKPEGLNTWWSLHAFNDSYCAADRYPSDAAEPGFPQDSPWLAGKGGWIGAWGVGVDVDFCSGDADDSRHKSARGKAKHSHSAPAADFVERIEEAVDAGHLPGNLYHRTAHGFRFAFVFDKQCTDRNDYARAAAALHEAVRLALVDLELHGCPGVHVDELLDLRRVFWSPRGWCVGPDGKREEEERNAQVIVMRPEPVCLAEIARAATPEPSRPAHQRRSAPVGTSDMEEAVRRYNADHSRNLPRKSGECPMCGKGGRFGRLPKAPERWSCFGASHPEVGCAPSTPGDPWTGDVLDLDTYERFGRTGDGHQRARIELLRADGYLSERRAETKPYEDREPFALTDTGNAKRLVRLHGADLRYCHPWGIWLAFDGSRWKADDTAQVDRWAKDAVRTIAGEAAQEEAEKRRTALLAHALKSQHAQRHRAMIDLARSEDGIPILRTEDGIPILPAHLDADPMLLNVENGTIDLGTNTFRDHRRADLISKRAAVRCAADATCPTFEKFLERIIPDRDLREYLQRAFGYCLTGDVGAQVLFFAHGGGANGKSTLLNSMLRLLGDYATRAPSELLLASRGDRHPTEKTVLHGRRLAVCYEANEGRRFDLAVVKSLTGGDPVTARGMRQDFWTFDPQHKLWLAANAKPVVTANDEATWRRIQCIPFEVTIPEKEQDPHLREKLSAELSGILNWALADCREWLGAGGGKRGLGEPSKVREATENYRVQEDVIGAFVEDRCVLLSTARTTKSQLYKEFTRWAEDNGESVLTQHDFNTRIAQTPNVGSSRTGKARLWIGIRIRTASVQDEIDPEVRAS